MCVCVWECAGQRKESWQQDQRGQSTESSELTRAVSLAAMRAQERQNNHAIANNNLRRTKWSMGSLRECLEEEINSERKCVETRLLIRFRVNRGQTLGRSFSFLRSAPRLPLA